MIKRRHIALTQERLKDLVRYEPETGLFWRLRTKGNPNPEYIMGSKSSHGYWESRVDGHLYRHHQLAFLYMTGKLPISADHINGDGSDNRWANLRDIPQKEQPKNQKRNKNNTSGLMGVFWDRGAWKVYIQSEGYIQHLGRTKDFFEACCLRKSAELHFGFHANHGRTSNGNI